MSENKTIKSILSETNFGPNKLEVFAGEQIRNKYERLVEEFDSGQTQSNYIDMGYEDIGPEEGFSSSENIRFKNPHNGSEISILNRGGWISFITGNSIKPGINYDNEYQVQSNRLICSAEYVIDSDLVSKPYRFEKVRYTVGGLSGFLDVEHYLSLFDRDLHLSFKSSLGGLISLRYSVYGNNEPPYYSPVPGIDTKIDDGEFKIDEYVTCKIIRGNPVMYFNFPKEYLGNNPDPLSFIIPINPLKTEADIERAIAVEKIGLPNICLQIEQNIKTEDSNKQLDPKENDDLTLPSNFWSK